MRKQKLNLDRLRGIKFNGFRKELRASWLKWRRGLEIGSETKKKLEQYLEQEDLARRVRTVRSELGNRRRRKCKRKHWPSRHDTMHQLQFSIRCRITHMALPCFMAPGRLNCFSWRRR